MSRSNIDVSPNNQESLFFSTSTGSPNSAEFSTAICSTTKAESGPHVQLTSPGGSAMGRSFKENTFSLRCRICLDSGSDEDLITPCNCSGTIGLIHKSCLEEWINVARTGHCEICGYEFKTNVYKPTFKQWLFEDRNNTDPNNRRHLWGDLICLLVMFPLVGMCSWLLVRAVHSYGKESFYWAVISLGIIFTVLFAFFTVWLVLAVRYHYQSWITWRDTHELHRVDTHSLQAVVLSPGRTHSVVQSRYHSLSNSSSESERQGAVTGAALSHHSGLFPPPLSPTVNASTAFFSPRFSLNAHAVDSFDRSGSSYNPRDDVGAAMLPATAASSRSSNRSSSPLTTSSNLSGVETVNAQLQNVIV